MVVGPVRVQVGLVAVTLVAVGLVPVALVTFDRGTFDRHTVPIGGTQVSVVPLGGAHVNGLVRGTPGCGVPISGFPVEPTASAFVRTVCHRSVASRVKSDQRLPAGPPRTRHGALRH